MDNKRFFSKEHPYQFKRQAIIEENLAEDAGGQKVLKLVQEVADKAKELSEDLSEAMVGINPAEIKIIMEERGK